MGRKIGGVVSVFVMFATGLTGLYNGLSDLGDALTPLQRSVLATRQQGRARLGAGARLLALAAFLLASAAGLGACRQLYGGPPVVADRGGDGLVTKRVRAKREPDRLIAEDLTVCWVVPEVFAGVKPGDHWRCAWRMLPRGQ